MWPFGILLAAHVGICTFQSMQYMLNGVHVISKVFLLFFGILPIVHMVNSAQSKTKCKFLLMYILALMGLMLYYDEYYLNNRMVNQFINKYQSLNRLSYLERPWKRFTKTYSPFVIESVFTFVMHEVVYFGAWLPFVVMDLYPGRFLKYKIQKEKKNQWGQTKKCLKRLFVSHLCIQLPMTLLTEWGLTLLGFSMGLPLPTVHTMFGQCLASFVLEDFYFYWMHRLLHWKKIYKHVHKVHHEHAAPFGIAAEYAHPVETVLLGIGTMIGPLLLMRHLLALWVWIAVRVLETVEDHSGYDVPWNITNCIPFWGGSVHHEHHHKTFEGNYASVFTIWDRVFQTDGTFRKAQQIRRQNGESEWTDLFDKCGRQVKHE